MIRKGNVAGRGLRGPVGTCAAGVLKWAGLVVALATASPAFSHGDTARWKLQPPTTVSIFPVPLPNLPITYIPETPLQSPGSIAGALLSKATGGLLSGPPVGATPTTPLPPPAVTLFESGQTRPLALSADGKTLYALNTPDGRLEVFGVSAAGLTPLTSVPVGIDPVAVAVRSPTEVWVVNHVSDSVSVVQMDASQTFGQVVRTLLVGDEPRDIVFAGPNHGRAFITTAHRGQNSPVDPAMTTPGIGRADVWVFDPANLGTAAGGTPLTILTLFTNAPRALAVSPQGDRVYAAGFFSDNQTASIFYVPVTVSGGPPGPLTNYQGIPRPTTGVIVRYKNGHWVDIAGRQWDSDVPFTLPDRDVFTIDATTSTPQLLGGNGAPVTGVGTVLFNMAVNPVSGTLYVSNLDALNDQQFVGPGTFAGRTLRGHFDDNRITVIKNGGATPRYLNKHVDYTHCCAPVPNTESETSLAFPVDMSVSADGTTLYVAALGSDKIGVFNTAALENNTFVPNQAAQIEVEGGGPTGIALDEPRNQLYVLSRFDNGLSVINLASHQTTQHLLMHTAEDPSITVGRRVLYDARHTSSHGDSACFSCHVYGDFDGIGWDLGNPDQDVALDPGPFAAPGALTVTTPVGVGLTVHPMKGPMVTQSLRGMPNHGPLHWRGDKTYGTEEASAEPDKGSFNTPKAFDQFNAAFPDVLGRSAQISQSDMDAFNKFAMQLTYPPNPLRQLNNQLTAAQQSGHDFYMNITSFAGATCNECHVLDPTGNQGYTNRPGFYGTTGLITLGDPELEQFKVPHLRNLYQKVGRFGMPNNPAIHGSGYMGEQLKGFGMLHDGGVDTVFSFMSNPLFQFPSDQMRRNIEDFQLAFDSNMAPIVGQQMTLNAATAPTANPRITLMEQRADAGECELAAKTLVNNQERGYLYIGQGTFVSDRASAPTLSDSALRSYAVSSGLNLTYTCVPPGSGVRLAVDRDLDQVWDGDERDHGTDPANGFSH